MYVSPSQFIRSCQHRALVFIENKATQMLPLFYIRVPASQAIQNIGGGC